MIYPFADKLPDYECGEQGIRTRAAIALSGYASQRDVDAALIAGFDAHIAKPFDPAMLAATIERLLRGKRR